MDRQELQIDITIKDSINLNSWSTLHQSNFFCLLLLHGTKYETNTNHVVGCVLFHSHMITLYVNEIILRAIAIIMGKAHNNPWCFLIWLTQIWWEICFTNILVLVIGIDTKIEVIVVSPEGCGELPRSLVTPQWPKLRYQFLFYHDASKHIKFMQIQVCISRKSLIKLLQIRHYGKHGHRPLSQKFT